METGKKIAFVLGIDDPRVAVCCAAHDLAREWTPSEYMEFFSVRGMNPEPEMMSKPVLLHGPAAAVILEEEFGIGDTEILSAVYHHTLGHPDIGSLGKILYIADYVEPGRKYVSSEFRARVLSSSTLNEMLRLVLEHAKARGKSHHPRTEAMYRSCIDPGPWGDRTATDVKRGIFHEVFGSLGCGGDGTIAECESGGKR